jgi:hypothetical protein
MDPFLVYVLDRGVFLPWTNILPLTVIVTTFMLDNFMVVVSFLTTFDSEGGHSLCLGIIMMFYKFYPSNETSAKLKPG